MKAGWGTGNLVGLMRPKNREACRALGMQSLLQAPRTAARPQTGQGPLGPKLQEVLWRQALVPLLLGRDSLLTDASASRLPPRRRDPSLWRLAARGHPTEESPSGHALGPHMTLADWILQPRRGR